MKITDYGLWYYSCATKNFTKIPKNRNTSIYLNGIFIGNRPPGYRFLSICTFNLNEIGFEINPESPGTRSPAFWNFPEGYVPTESDFEEIE